MKSALISIVKFLLRTTTNYTIKLAFKKILLSWKEGNLIFFNDIHY